MTSNGATGKVAFNFVMSNVVLFWTMLGHNFSHVANHVYMNIECHSYAYESVKVVCSLYEILKDGFFFYFFCLNIGYILFVSCRLLILLTISVCVNYQLLPTDLWLKKCYTSLLYLTNVLQHFVSLFGLIRTIT